MKYFNPLIFTDFDQHVSHSHLQDSTPIFFLLFAFSFSLYSFISICPASHSSQISFFLSCLESFWLFSASVSFLGEKTEMLEWNQPPLLPCVLACPAWVFVRERAHAWASSAVKVRLIHWLQLRAAEGLAEFNSNLFTLLRPANADRSVCATGCLPPGEDWRARASFYSNSLSLCYLANFGHVSNPHSKAGCLACFQIIAPFITKGPRGWLNLFAGSWSPFVVCILLLKLSLHQEAAGWLLLT